MALSINYCKQASLKFGDIHENEVVYSLRFSHVNGCIFLNSTFQSQMKVAPG